LFNLALQCVKPGHPVRFAEWNAATHFIDVGFRVKIVAIQEQATYPLGQLDTDGCFAGTAYTSNDDHHGVSGYEQAYKYCHHEANQ
jgi:hypothetical protein